MPLLTCPVPSTISTLNPNGFQFSIQKYPELDYFVQNIQLPAISLPPAAQASRVHDFHHPGETMEFGELNVEFLVDEKMANYEAIFAWIVGLAFPEGNEQFTALLESTRNSNAFSTSSKTMSDATLMIMDSNNKPLKRFVFVDCFPTGLSALSFQSNNSDVNYLVATVNLQYSYYSVA